MIEPLRYHKETAPTYEIERPVFCTDCITNKYTRNNPNIATIFCKDCAIFINGTKEKGAFLCKTCDASNHEEQTLLIKEHLRQMLVVGPGVRKRLIDRGDAVNFPSTLDNVRIKLKLSVFQNGRRVHREPYRFMSYTSGMSGKCLHVQLLGARGIRASDYNNSADPFVVYSFCGKPVSATRVRPRTRNPNWDNETFVIPLEDHLPLPKNTNPSQRDIVKFEVFDYDWFTQNDFLGQVEMTRQKLTTIAMIAKEKPIRLPLNRKQYHGTVNVSFAVDATFLYIKVNSAEDLDKQDLFRFSHPYAKVFIAEKQIGCTGVINNTMNPTWMKNNEFKVKLTDYLAVEAALEAQIKFYRASQTANQHSQYVRRKHHHNNLNTNAHDNSYNQSSTSFSLPFNLSIIRVEVHDHRKLRGDQLLGKSWLHTSQVRNLVPDLPTANEILFQTRFANSTNNNSNNNSAQNSFRVTNSQNENNNNTRSSGLSSFLPRGLFLNTNNQKDQPQNNQIGDHQPVPQHDDYIENFDENHPQYLSALDYTLPPPSTVTRYYQNLMKCLRAVNRLLVSLWIVIVSIVDFFVYNLCIRDTPTEESQQGIDHEYRHSQPASEHSELGGSSSHYSSHHSSHQSNTLDNADQLDIIESNLDFNDRGNHPTTLLVNNEEVIYRQGSGDSDEDYSSNHQQTQHQQNEEDQQDREHSNNNNNTNYNLLRRATRSMKDLWQRSRRQLMTPPDANINSNNPTTQQSHSHSNILQKSHSFFSKSTPQLLPPPLQYTEKYRFPLYQQDAIGEDGVTGSSSHNDEECGYVIVRLLISQRGVVLSGLDEGIRQMSIGEKAQIKCRYDYVYGNYSLGSTIPPRAHAIFTVRLLEINNSGKFALPIRMAKRAIRYTVLMILKFVWWIIETLYQLLQYLGIIAFINKHIIQKFQKFMKRFQRRDNQGDEDNNQDNDQALTLSEKNLQKKNKKDRSNQRNKNKRNKKKPGKKNKKSKAKENGLTKDEEEIFGASGKHWTSSMIQMMIFRAKNKLPDEKKKNQDDDNDSNDNDSDDDSDDDDDDVSEYSSESSHAEDAERAEQEENAAWDEAFGDGDHHHQQQHEHDTVDDYQEQVTNDGHHHGTASSYLEDYSHLDSNSGSVLSQNTQQTTTGVGQLTRKTMKEHARKQSLAQRNQNHHPGNGPRRMTTTASKTSKQSIPIPRTIPPHPRMKKHLTDSVKAGAKLLWNESQETKQSDHSRLSLTEKLARIQELTEKTEAQLQKIAEFDQNRKNKRNRGSGSVKSDDSPQYSHLQQQQQQQQQQDHTQQAIGRHIYQESIHSGDESQYDEEKRHTNGRNDKLMNDDHNDDGDDYQYDEDERLEDSDIHEDSLVDSDNE